MYATYPPIPASDHEHFAAADARFADLSESGRPLLRAAVIEKALDAESEKRLFRLAATAPNAKKKLFWLHRAADVIERAVNIIPGVSPCKSGCSHCCNIPVVISETEARHLAEVTGRPLTVPARSVALNFADLRAESAGIAAFQADGLARHTGQPCPFLLATPDAPGGTCSVYADRPLACRYHVSLDDDDLLCRLAEGAEIKAPYLDNMKRTAVAVSILGPTKPLADIRDWFPAEASGSP